MSRRTLAVCAVAVLAGSIALSGSAGASPATPETVTLAVQQWYDKPSKQQKTRFTGTVSSGASGEDVTVMQQVCGYNFGTTVAGTQTQSGGFWAAEPAGAYVIAPSATYRAKWGSETSAPVVIRPRIPVSMIAVGKGRLLFSVSIGGVYQPLLGKPVVLQRKLGKTWKRVQQRKLRFDPSIPNGTYRATFIAKRGWTVRAQIRTKTAAPCFKPGTTPKVKVA